MFISVDIEIGSEILCRMPIWFDLSQKKVNIDFKDGKVVKIVNMSGDKIVYFTNSSLQYRVDEYRIMRFTFGGIFIDNPKWDVLRIKQEDDNFIYKIIEKYNLKKI